MEKEFIIGIMVKDMKEILKMIKLKEKELNIIKLEFITMGNSKIEKEKEKVFYIILQGIEKWEII